MGVASCELNDQEGESRVNRRVFDTALRPGTEENANAGEDLEEHLTWRTCRCTPSRNGGELSGTVVTAALLAAALSTGCVTAPSVWAVPRDAVQGMTPAPADRTTLTPAQRKIDSNLRSRISEYRKDPHGGHAVSGTFGIRVDKDGRALVDVRADVTTELERKLADAGGRIVSTWKDYRSIIAWLPLLKLEELAEDRAIHAIVPAAEGRTEKR